MFAFDGSRFHKFRCLDKEHEVYHYEDRLPVFGAGHFLHLDGNRTGSSYPHSNTYEQPEDGASSMDGEKTFQIAEVEVFGVQLGPNRL